MLPRLGAHNLSLKLKYLLTIKAIAIRSMKQAALNSFVRFRLAAFYGRAKFGIFRFPPIESCHMNAEKVSNFNISCPKQAKLLGLSSEFRPI